MAQCRGVAYIGTSYAKPCSRKAHEGLAFCWQHGEQARDAVTALQHQGRSSPDFMLQHLSYRSRAFEQGIFQTTISRKHPRALRTLDGNRDGLSLGSLEPLPLEVLYEIFSYLSIPDVRSFKATNSRGHLMATSDTRYSSVVTHAPGFIAALYITGLQNAFTIGRIYTALTRPTCTVCNKFAGYLDLPGLQRCCQRCAMYDNDLQPLLSENLAIDLLGPKTTEAVPRMLLSSDNYDNEVWATAMNEVLVVADLEKSCLISKADVRSFTLSHGSPTYYARGSFYKRSVLTSLWICY